MVIDRSVYNGCTFSVCPSFSHRDLSFYLFIYLFIYFIFSNSRVIKTRKVINPDFGPQLEICLSVYSYHGEGFLSVSERFLYFWTPIGNLQ